MVVVHVVVTIRNHVKSCRMLEDITAHLTNQNTYLASQLMTFRMFNEHGTEGARAMVATQKVAKPPEPTMGGVAPQPNSLTAGSTMKNKGSGVIFTQGG
jgi:hypothetical protein